MGFNKGDLVRFTDADNIGWNGSKEGAVYEVEFDDDGLIHLVGDDNGADRVCFEDRLSLVTRAADREFDAEFSALTREVEALRAKGYTVTVDIAKTLQVSL